MFQAIIIRGQSPRYRSYIAWPSATFQKYNECKQKPLYLHSPTKATTRSVGFAHETHKYQKVVWNTNLVFQTTSPQPYSLRQISTQTLPIQPIISSSIRHSRAGGNPSETLRNRYSKNSCRNSRVDSRLHGNDGKQISRCPPNCNHTTRSVDFAHESTN